MPLEYTEISTKTISRGTNVNATTALTARRVVGFTTSATHGDPVDLISVTGAAKAKGVALKNIAVGDTGDIATEGVVPVESDGTATIAAGDMLTVNVTAGATEGRVLKAIPGTGVNSFIVGKAHTPAAATAGAVLMMEIRLSVMQGQ
jgi:predicted RecA/RadA family phage recombinase